MGNNFKMTKLQQYRELAELTLWPAGVNVKWVLPKNTNKAMRRDEIILCLQEQHNMNFCGYSLVSGHYELLLFTPPRVSGRRFKYA